MRLLKRRILRFTFRRSAWMRWLPPIERASPSPVTTHTERSGRVTARPVAIAEARRAADPGDEDDSFASEAELRHEALDDVEDRVVAAARAPADLLIGLEVLPAQLHETAVSVALCHQESTSAVIASASSVALNGRPRTLL